MDGLKLNGFFSGYYNRLLEGRYDINVVNEFFDVLQNYRYCVIGGFAVGLYTKDYNRVSLGDIDIIINRSDVSAIIEDLGSRGFSFERGMTEKYGILLFSKNGYEFDILVPDDDIANDAIYDRKLFVYKGRRYYVCPIWFLIYSKLISSRDKDMTDIEKLVNIMSDRDIDLVISKLMDIDEMLSSEFENIVYYVKYS